MRPVVFVLFVLCACGTETGNGLDPRGTATAKVGLVSSLGLVDRLSGIDEQNTSLAITAARAYVRSIELVGGAQNATLDGPYDANLISRTTNPALMALELDAGMYGRVDVRFTKAKPNDGVVPAGDPLDGQTMIAEGLIAYPPGEETPFDLALHFEDTVSFQDVDGVELEADEHQELLLDLDVALWFSTLPITRCLEEGDLQIVDGRIPIVDRGNNKCKDIERALREAIIASAKLRRE